MRPGRAWLLAVAVWVAGAAVAQTPEEQLSAAMQTYDWQAAAALAKQAEADGRHGFAAESYRQAAYLANQWGSAVGTGVPRSFARKAVDIYHRLGEATKEAAALATLSHFSEAAERPALVGRALELAKPDRTPFGWSVLIDLWGPAQSYDGKLGLAIAQDLVARAEELGDRPRSLNVRADLDQYDAGKTADEKRKAAEQLARDAADIVAKSRVTTQDNELFFSHGCWKIGRTLVESGDYDAAGDVLALGAEVDDTWHYDLGLVGNLSLLAEVRVLQGREAEARQNLAMVADKVLQPGGVPGLGPYQTLDKSWYAAAHALRADDQLERLRYQTVRGWRAGGSPFLGVMMGASLYRQGDLKGAEAVLRETLASTQQAKGKTSEARCQGGNQEAPPMKGKTRLASLALAGLMAGAAMAQTPVQQLDAARQTYDWRAAAAIARQAEADGRLEFAAEAYERAADLTYYWGHGVVSPDVSVPLARKAAEIYHRLGKGELEAVALRYVAVLLPASERLPVVKQTLGLIKPYRTKLTFDVLFQFRFLVMKDDPKLSAAIYQDELALADELGDRVFGLLARSDQTAMAARPVEQARKVAAELAREARSIAADGAVDGQNDALFSEACANLAIELRDREDYEPAEQVLGLSVEQAAACGNVGNGIVALSLLAAVQVRHNGNPRALENVVAAADMLVGGGGRVAGLGPYQAMDGQWYSAAHYLRADEEIMKVADSSVRLMRAGQSTFPGVVVAAALYRQGDLKGAEAVLRETLAAGGYAKGHPAKAMCKAGEGTSIGREGSAMKGKVKLAAAMAMAAMLAGPVVAQTPQQQFDAAEAAYDWQAMAAVAKQAEADGRHDFAAKAYGRAAYIANQWGPSVVRPEVFIPFAREAAEIYLRQRDTEHEAGALLWLATYLPASERIPVARQALELIKPYRTAYAFDILFRIRTVLVEVDPKLSLPMAEDQIALAAELGDRVLGLWAKSERLTVLKPSEEVCKEAEQLAREAADIAASGRGVTRDRVGSFAGACRAIAMVLSQRGDYDPAEQVLAVGVEQAVAGDGVWDGILTLSSLATVQARRNEGPRALESVTRAVDMLVNGVPYLGPYQPMHTEWYPAAHYLRADEQILRIADSSLRLMRSRRSPFPGVVVAGALYRQGDLRGAEAILREVMASSGYAKGHPGKAMCEAGKGSEVKREGSRVKTTTKLAAAMAVAAMMAGPVVAQTPEDQRLAYTRASDWQALATLAKQAEADGRHEFAALVYSNAVEVAVAWGPRVVSQDVVASFARKEVEIYHRLGDNVREAGALYQLAGCLPKSEWLPLLTEALKLLKPERTRPGLDALGSVWALLTEADPKLAVVVCEERVALAGELGDRVESLSARADLLQSADKPREELRKQAEEMAREAASIAGTGEKLDYFHSYTLLVACWRLAVEMYTWEDYEPAEQMLTVSADYAANCGDDGISPTAVQYLGALARVQVCRNGSSPKALQNLTSAVDRALEGSGGQRSPLRSMDAWWYSAAHYLRADDQIKRVSDSGVRVARAGLSPFPGLVTGAELYRTGDLQGAEGLIREISTTTTDPWGMCSEALCRLWLGRVLYAEGKVGEAEAELQKGFAGEETADALLKPDYVEARVDYALAKLGVGKADEAEALARKAVEGARAAQYLPGEVDALGVLAVALTAEGKAQEAAKAGEDAAAAAKSLDDRDAKLWSASVLATVYGDVGAGEMAQAATGGTGPMRRNSTTSMLRQRAKVLRAQGQGEAAEQNLALALKLDRAMGKAGFAAEDLYGLGLAASAKGQEAQAEGLLGQALEASRQTGYKTLEADTTVELMAARLMQGKTAPAEELAAPLDALVKEMKTAPLQVRAGEVEGWLAEVKNDSETAAKRYSGAIDALERIRGGLTVEALHVGLMKAHAGLYGRMVAVLAQRAEEGKPAPVGVGNGEEVELTALHYAEAGRARALLAEMAGVFSADLQGLGDADAAGLKAAEDGVAESRQALWAELSKRDADKAKAEALSRDVRKKQGDADALRDRMLAKYPASAMRAGREQVLGGGDAMQVCIDRTCAALVYWVGEDESWGWVIDPWKRQVKMFKVAMGRQQLAEAIDRVQKALTADPPAKDVADAALGELSKALLGEAGALLPKGKRLVIVPDGPLYDLPFGLLTVQGQKLVERTTVSYLPSLSLLRALEEVRFAADAKQKASVLARPKSPDPRYVDLPGTEDEAKAVGGELGAGAKVLLGDQATEAAAKLSARQDDILHLAAHGILDRKQPSHSAILLTPGGGEDGLLEAGEVARLTIGSKLVVLSACHGAGGGSVFGEGLVGMTRAFFAGGAKAVVASPWQVPDKAAAEFMKAFYAQLKVTGEPARALQAAQMEMAAKAPAAAWAPFAYYGAP